MLLFKINPFRVCELYWAENMYDDSVLEFNVFCSRSVPVLNIKNFSCSCSVCVICHPCSLVKTWFGNVCITWQIACESRFNHTLKSTLKSKILTWYENEFFKFQIMNKSRLNTSKELFHKLFSIKKVNHSKFCIDCKMLNSVCYG